jgi:GT2 family glycosyltransferase
MLFDVVIPIHNALTETRACIESVLQHSTEEYRLILVNDGSDEETTDYLNSIPKATVLHLTGVGYLKAINQGLTLFRSEYKVSLNSDTVVTKNWLTKLRQCAESDASIGLATPLSSNGIGLSLLIPAGFNFLEVSDIVDSRTKRLYPDACTVLGYCLFIRQSVIDTIGVFDIAFDPGYYEECDYHFRAEAAGFRAVVCDDLFIYHKGQASFKEQKTAILNKNRVIFHERWNPVYRPEYSKVDELDVLGYLREKRGKHLKNKPLLQPLDVAFVLPPLRVGVSHVLTTVNALIMQGVRAGIIAFWPTKDSLNCYTTPIMYSNSEGYLQASAKSKLYITDDDKLIPMINQKIANSGGVLKYLPKDMFLLDTILEEIKEAKRVFTI